MATMTSSGHLRVKVTSMGLDARTINKEVEKILNRKEKSITHNPELRIAISTQYAESVKPFIPMSKTTNSHIGGTLRNSYHVENDGRIQWRAVNPKDNFHYAHLLYTHEYEHYTTPGTGPMWTKQLNPNTGGEPWENFIQEITPLIKETYRNG